MNGGLYGNGVPKNDIHVCGDAELFSDAYAIGTLEIANGGHGDLQWSLLSSIDGSVIDQVTITK